MKKIILILIALSFSNLTAQFTVNQWYFGYYAGLDFNDGEPRTIQNSAIYQWEGSASICDKDGDILLYSNGISVWNKFNRVVPEANDLQGGNSSTQSSIFVPDPSNSNQVYVFTSDAIESPRKNGLRYSLIDYTHNNFEGKVIFKNRLLIAPASEKLTAIKVPFENSYWIIAHAWEESEFLVYKVTAEGVSLYQKFSTNMYDDIDRNNDPNRAAGYLKFNVASSKLCAAAEGKGFYLYDFNIMTGEITNEMGFIGGDTKYAYGVEFSKNGNFLYISTIEPLDNWTYSLNEIYQFEINSNNQQTILNSKVKLIDRIKTGAAIQMAPDGRIYLGKGEQFLDRINFPDLKGNSCDLELNAIDLGSGKSAHFGFPNFIQELLPSNLILSGTNEICEDETITISANEIQNAIYNWYGPNNFSSNNRIIEISNANRNISGYYYCEVNVNNKYKLLDSFFVQVNYTDFELSRKTVIFPEICLGNSTFYEIYLVNTGNTAIGISRVDFDDGAFSFTAFDKMILPNDSLKITLNYESYKSGEFENIFYLEIQSNCGTKDISLPLFISVIPRNIMINVPDIAGVPGEKVCFDITGSSTCEVVDDTFSFALAFDPRTFYISDISKGRIDKLEYQNESTLFARIILDEVILTDTMSILTTICGEVLLDRKKTSIFNVTDINDYDSNDLTVKTGTLSIGEICVQDLRYIKLFDLAFITVNVLGESAEIEIKGEEVGKFKLEVFNSAMQTVLFREWQSDGEFMQTFTLDKLASGNYFIILTTPSRYEVKQKFIIIK